MSDSAPHTFVNPLLERIASSVLAAKEYEGEGRIIHDSYTKEAYTKRRHWFLGNHRDFGSNPQLLPKITLETHQVFDSQADELSVEQVRSRELACEIDPLLPFPTSTNTKTLDNFRSTGTKEWTAETGHPSFSRSAQTSPRIPATEPTNQDVPAIDWNAGLELGKSPVSDERIKASNVGQIIRRHRQTVAAGPDPEPIKQQTTTNPTFPSSHIFNQSSASSWLSTMNEPQAALNIPEDHAVMLQIINALGAPEGSLRPSDAPQQYQKLQHFHRPQHQVSAVKSRALDTPVKSQNGGKKRAAPVDLEDADANASIMDQGTSRPSKRARIPSKKPRETVTAGEDPIDLEKPARRPAAKQPRAVQAAATAVPKAAIQTKGRATPATPSVESSVTGADPTANGSGRPTLGGKSLPLPAGNAAAKVPRRPSHPACVNGNRLPKSRNEAAEAAVERKQALLLQMLNKKRKVRHPDLGPEFFDTFNFTEDEKDPSGEPPVRCVCGAKDDKRNFTGEWIGCDNGECRVWQHVPCMGEAVPVPEKREDGNYLCQQCDPFAHRRLIQRLRKNQPLP